MRDVIVSLFLVGSVVMGASETAGVTEFMEGDNPLVAAVRSNLPGAFGEMAGPASVSAAPLDASGQTMFIAFTEGTGVRARTSCADDAEGVGGLAEGASVQVVAVGGAECPGWAQVRSGNSTLWVRLSYLNAGDPARGNGGASTASSGQANGRGAGNENAHGGNPNAQGGNVNAQGGNANAQGGNANAQGGNANVQGGNANAQGGNANAQGGNANAQGGNANAQTGGASASQRRSSNGGLNLLPTIVSGRSDARIQPEAASGARQNAGGNSSESGQGWGQGVGGGQEKATLDTPPGNSENAASKAQ